MITASLALTFSSALALGQPQAVTFEKERYQVGEVCTSKTHVLMRFEGERHILDAFGTERGGDTNKETTVLAVREDGSAQKIKVRFTKHVGSYLIGGERRIVPEPSDGQSYILTRIDDAGHFTATREDGSAPDAGELDDLHGELDRSFPGMLDGRTLKMREVVAFSEEEMKRYFPWEDSDGMKMRGAEVRLGAIEKGGTVARVDVKFLVDVSGTRGEGNIKAWATIRTDLAQKKSRTMMEGPLRVNVPYAVEGIGERAAPGTVKNANYVLKGTVEADMSEECVMPVQ